MPEGAKIWSYRVECRMVRAAEGPQVASNLTSEIPVLPDPLHPAVVHFPIVLMFLLPISALVALWAIRRGTAVRMAWAVPVAFAAALTLSAWAALQTGNEQGEAVEKQLSESVIENHEEAAELFLILSGVVLVLTAAGVVSGRAAGVVRTVATVSSVALIIAGARVGKSGGSLVYEHGAGAAISQSATTGGAGVGGAAEGATGAAAEGAKGERGGESEADERRERKR